MAIFLYSTIFLVASPVLIFLIWVMVKYHRKREEAYEEADYQARLAKALEKKA